jgi:hypothetical protein
MFIIKGLDSSRRLSAGNYKYTLYPAIKIEGHKPGKGKTAYRPEKTGQNRDSRSGGSRNAMDKRVIHQVGKGNGY